MIFGVLSSWNKSELMIPPLFFNYGYYKMVYTVKMEDPSFQPWMKFQKSTQTYIKIIKSPLNIMAVENAVSRFTRGIGQDMILEPVKFSSDPDWPDTKNFTVSYRCKKLGETWPNSSTAQPVTPKGPLSTGCFGYGPGLLDNPDDYLLVTGYQFTDFNTTYELEVTIQKDTRTATTTTEVVIVERSVPIVNIRCTDVALCPSREGIVYVNPSYKLRLVSECISSCSSAPLAFKWVMSDAGGVPFAVTTTHFPLGVNRTDLSVDVSFFKDNPTVTELRLAVDVTDTTGAVGSSSFLLRLNQPPALGNCTFQAPATSRALIDLFSIECQGWSDPENVGVRGYKFILAKNGSLDKTLAELLHGTFDKYSTQLVLPSGIFDIVAEISDVWGAFYRITLASSLEVVLPTQEELASVNTTELIASLTSSGQSSLLTMVLAAQSDIMAKASWEQLSAAATANLSQEAIDQLVIAMADKNNAALDSLLETTNFNSLSSLESASGSLSTLMETVSSSPTASKTIDLSAREKVVTLVENMVAGLDNIEIPTPEMLQSFAQNILTAVAGISMGTADVNADTKNCSSASPADMKNALNMDYDTSLPDDINFEVPTDLATSQRCSIQDKTKGATADQAPRMDKALESLSKSILKKLVVGEEMTITSPNGMEMKMALLEGDALKEPLTLGSKGSSITFPENFCPTGCSAPLAVSAKEWPGPTHPYAGNAMMLSPNGRVIEIDLFTRNLDGISVSNLETPITLSMTRDPPRQPPPEPEKVNASGASAEQTYPVMYTTFNVSSEGLSVNVEITPKCPEHRLFVMISRPRLPTLRNHEIFSMVVDIPTKRNGTYDWFIRSSLINGTGRFFVGVGEFKKDFDPKLMSDPTANDVKNDVMTNVTCDYTMRVFTAGCFYFNTKEKSWMSNGLEVVYADSQRTTCEATHLTSFGSGFIVAPNTIDFNYVFANMGFDDNLTIYITLIISITIFILMMVWARLKDRKDVMKLGAAPLPDNKVEDKYLYEMLVFTGNKKEAQTDSTVQFILSGNQAETDVRTLGDDRRKILRKADVDVFILAVSRPLGSLQFLRIWHNNSGKGPNASWFLSYIVFRDVQTGEKYEFIANQWFAVEREDGKIDRLLQVAGEQEKTAFKHLFDAKSTKNISDAHLWFSVFLRPPRSRFTRCQRVGCCFALLFLSMLVNAMWYGTVTEQPGTGGLQFGPFNLSPEQIGVGVMSNIIVFLPSTVIVLLFRKSRPRKLRKSRVQEAVERTRRQAAKVSNPVPRGKDVESEGNNTSEDKISPQNENKKEQEEEEKKKKKKKLTLPWWCVIIAWILVWVCIAASCFFLLMYGIQFGNTKTTKWVTSLIISFFSSILFVQPLKIFAMAIFASLICKSGDLDVDDADEDEEDPDLQYDETWLHSESNGKKPKVLHKEADSVLLKVLRERRQRELEMYMILKEVFSYFMFIWVLLVLSYGNRDPNAFFLRQTLTQNFIHEGLGDSTDFSKVSNSDELWSYLQTGLLSNLRLEEYYNGQPPYGLKGFFNDQCNRIMGYATIKQIRTKLNTCRVPEAMKFISKRCSGYAGASMEDEDDYCENWQRPTNLTRNDSSCQAAEFKHTSALTLASMPVWGSRDWYGAGGYVIRLQGSSKSILDRFTYLQKHKWINEGTRAVLVEFSSYNAQVNLFGTVRIMAEFTPGGGITPSYRFDGIKLIQHHDNFGLFVIICEASFVLFVLYYTYREISLVCKDKRAYFTSYWSYAEIAIIIASYSAMILYGLRYFATSKVLDIFNRTFGNGYVSLQYAASLDAMYGYIIAFIVFVGSLKFIKLLRFNKRMGVLSATLALCWDDLQGFMIAFCVSFVAFSILFFLLLSAFLVEFSNFIGTVETAFSMMLGKFNFDEMKEANSLTPMMFFIFVLCNSWVLINLLLTVIIKSFEEIKHDLKKQPDDYVLVPFILERFKALLGIQQAVQIAPLKTTAVTVPSKDADNVKELPDKVDKFVQFLDQMYFGGKLQQGKEGLKGSQNDTVRAGWYGELQEKSQYRPSQ
ncbi:location of vulva defective 1-like [Macrobrachium nipponense]|uniref:location of vulva defective 1-like n=1 Tax=Macrobrachium nipponense TaxID=159736 RepID=UPI0030C83248